MHYCTRWKSSAHSPSKVYPTLADGVALTAGASWVLGAFVEVEDDGVELAGGGGAGGAGYQVGHVGDFDFCAGV